MKGDLNGQPDRARRLIFPLCYGTQALARFSAQSSIGKSDFSSKTPPREKKQDWLAEKIGFERAVAYRA
jgi:hypothetical protein